MLFKSCLLAIVLMVAAASAQAPARPLPLENVDIENTLKNEKLVRKYIDCVLERSRCDSNGRDLKEILPRVLNTNCADCSPKQKDNANRITDFMKTNHMSEWSLINAKYSTSE